MDIKKRLSSQPQYEVLAQQGLNRLCHIWMNSVLLYMHTT
jgi:hypothetical protein